MKWRKETQVYMWAHYFSENGKWMAWDESFMVKTNRRKYNPITKKFEQIEAWKHVWFLKNLLTSETIDQEFKTLTAAKQFAEKEDK